MSVKAGSDDQLRRNTRIILDNYYADIFADESAAEPLFHWMIERSDVPGVVVLGEQTTYEIARQEAEHHLARLAEADKSAILAQPNRAYGS